MFTMDVIASTAFGLKIDSQKDKKQPFCDDGKEENLRWITRSTSLNYM